MPRTVIERTLTLKDQLVPVSFLSSDLLYIPTIVILILLVLSFALVLYVISLRIVFNTGQKLRKKQFEIWENLTLKYLSGEVSSKKIAKEVRIKHFSLFSEFMEKYLETLKGDDFQSLTHLLKEMGLFDYNLKRLGSRKRWHRVYAAFFLGLMRDKEAVPALGEGVEDRDSLVSFVCAIALAKIGEKRHLKETLLILTRRKDLRPGRAAGVLLEFGSGACAELGLLLGNESVTRQWKYLIIDLLGYWQHLEAGPMLLELLQVSDDRQMKMRCIKALGQMSYIDSASTLASYLDDEDYLERLEAVKALGRIGIWDYSAKMARCLSDENWHVRYHTAQALAELERIFQSPFFEPISIIAPAYNEEATIAQSVEALLHLQYPQHEVVVVSDGSKDNTMQVLIERYGMVSAPITYPSQIECKKIKQVYVSPEYPNLVLVDKENGGKGDAMNAGINVSRYPLVCFIDADSILESDALLKVVRPFLEDPTTIGVGGIVRIANGCKVKSGEVVKVGMPKNSLGI